MWDMVCQLNVYRRTYKAASPRGEKLCQFIGDSFQFIARLRDLGFLHETGPCPRCCRSGRQRFSGRDCPANSTLVSRYRWWSVARPDLRVLARRCATILEAPTPPPNGVAGEGNCLDTTTRGPQPGLGLLVCGRCPGPDVPEFPCVMLLPLLPRGGGFPRARPLPPGPAFCAADAPHEHLHVHPRALPGRHSCTSHEPAEIWERHSPHRPALLLRETRWSAGTAAFAAAVVVAPAVVAAAAVVVVVQLQPSLVVGAGQQSSRCPPGLGRRVSSTTSCGGGGVVKRSSSDGCPWLACAAESSKPVAKGVPDDSTNGLGESGGTALQL